MWCEFCQSDVQPQRPARTRIDQLRGNVPLILDRVTSICPTCQRSLGDGEAPDHQRGRWHQPGHVDFDSWNWQLGQQLADVRRLLTRSADLRARYRPAANEPADGGGDQTVPELDLPRVLVALKKCAHQPAALRLLVPSALAFLSGGALLGWSLLSGETVLWNARLAAGLTGQAALWLGGLLLFLEIWRKDREISNKIDTTIAGLHVLRKEIKTEGSVDPPTGGETPRGRLSQIKYRIRAIARATQC
jgi:hypothetical protein